ncbi:MAG: hypothetical protein RL264_65 [Bacteroidota bacterium]|jgi:hypothetical protein
MATLPTYQNLESKANAFEQRIINTKEEVQAFFMSNIKENIAEEKSRRFIYRGVTNSRYKIFSSAQRNFAEKELSNITTYDNLIAGTIQEALNYQDGLLRKYLQGFNIPYDIPVLSFLQHYGAPTPLIDWTYNVEVAAFFTTDGQKHNASNTDIDNYFSIYCIDKKACGGDLMNISKWLADVYWRIMEIREHHPEADASAVINRFNEFNYFTFRDLSLFFISDFERIQDIPAIASQSNLNIINQQGLFIFNSSEDEPLESYFGTHRDPFSGLPRIKCFDFHKSLYYYVLNEITEARRDAGLIPLTKEFIYPQEEDIAKRAFENYLKR